MEILIKLMNANIEYLRNGISQYLITLELNEQGRNIDENRSIEKTITISGI
jgi:hypothetical protein